MATNMKRIEITVKVMDAYTTEESMSTLVSVPGAIAGGEYIALRDYLRAAEDLIRMRAAMAEAQTV